MLHSLNINSLITRLFVRPCVPYWRLQLIPPTEVAGSDTRNIRPSNKSQGVAQLVFKAKTQHQPFGKKGGFLDQGGVGVSTQFGDPVWWVCIRSTRLRYSQRNVSQYRYTAPGAKEEEVPWEFNEFFLRSYLTVWSDLSFLLRLLYEASSECVRVLVLIKLMVIDEKHHAIHVYYVDVSNDRSLAE